MSSHALWYSEAIARVAREAHARLMKGEGPLYPYFKPRGLEFKIFDDDADTVGYELVTGERIPSHLTVEQLTMKFHDLGRSVPVLPGD